MTKIISVKLILLGLLIPVLVSCAGETGNPISTPVPQIKSDNGIESPGGTKLWGFFEVSIDLENMCVSAIPNRNSQFTANVVNFLNSNPLNLKFSINETVVDTGYIDVDIDVAIVHPFPGLPEYNGYDVRGIFMGNGSASLATSGVIYPVLGDDQSMLADPDDGDGAPDGYSRWFNRPEFSHPGMPLFTYTPGLFASSDFDGNATICPYKYFADGLGTDEDLWSWMVDNPDRHGQFSSGATNARNYYIRFPNPDPGVQFGYAVIADWLGTGDEYHPSNAAEAVACDVTDRSSCYYVDETMNGGTLDLDFSLWGWCGAPSTIYIESTVLSSPYELDGTEMIPIDGDENFSTWHVEIIADNVNGITGNEYWVIPQYNTDYGNDFGISNDAEDDPLMAYFRYDLTVIPDPGNLDPVCEVIIVTEDLSDWVEVDVEFDASGSYDPNPGDILSFEWDFNDDGIFDGPEDTYSGDPDNPTHTYTDDFNGVVSVKVSDGVGGESICMTDSFVVEIIDCGTPEMPSGGQTEWSKTGPSLWMYAGIIRLHGDTSEYGGCWTYNYISQGSPPEVKYGLTSFELTSSGFDYNHYSEYDHIYDQLISNQGLTVTSTNRVYCFDVRGNAEFDSELIYYSDWDESSGFTMPIVDAGFPKVNPWRIIKMTIDENDYPVALCYRYSLPQLCIKHWNGNSWDEILIDDSAIIMSENYNNWGGLYRLAYNPVSDTYWITNRANQYWNSGQAGYFWRGTPTIYAINSDGSTAWKDTDVYPEIADQTDAGAFMVGVYMDPDDPDCRILVEVGCYAWVFNPGPPPGVFEPRSIRYDPFGNQLGYSDMPYPDSSGYYQYAVGSVVTWDSVSYYTNPTNFDLLGTLEIPDW